MKTHATIEETEIQIAKKNVKSVEWRKAKLPIDTSKYYIRIKTVTAGEGKLTLLKQCLIN